MILKFVIWYLKKVQDKACDKADGCMRCVWFEDEKFCCYIARTIDRFEDYY